MGYQRRVHGGELKVKMGGDDKVMGQGPFGTSYYLKGALAGGIFCSLTHGAACPIDVVKTRMQLDPVKYNQGLVGGFRQVIAEEGAMALSTGLGPTAQGYFIQGWFKFGGVELCKIQFVRTLGEESAFRNQTPIYLASAAMAEFVADIFLCPYEACRIRLVSDPTYATSMVGTAKRLVAENGVMGGFYSALCQSSSSRSHTPWPSSPCRVKLPTPSTRPSELTTLRWAQLETLAYHSSLV